MAIGRKHLPDSGSLYNQSSNDYTDSKLYQNQYNLVDDKVIEVQDLVVHKFLMGDVDDPVLYAAQPLYEWQESEVGKWVMEHAVEVPSWHQQVDYKSFGHVFIIKARLKAKDATYFRLKWGNEIDNRKQW